MTGKTSISKKLKPAAKRATATVRSRKKRTRSLEDVVGPEVYQVWVSMLRALVPEGRTHRLAPLLAAMLQYALIVAGERQDEDVGEGSVIQSLLDSTDVSEAEEVHDLLHDVVDCLFKDAHVQFRRTNARGEPYSIAEDAYQEYVHWFDMPWE